MAFDFKKEYKEFYMPKNKPSIVDVPPMNYIAVRGKGDPNEEGGDYKRTWNYRRVYAFRFGPHHAYQFCIHDLTADGGRSCERISNRR